MTTIFTGEITVFPAVTGLRHFQMYQHTNDSNSSGDSSASDHSIEEPPSLNQTMWNKTRETGIYQSDHAHFNRSHDDASLINPGPPAQYRLNTARINFDGTDGKVRLWTYGKKDRSKQNKIILIVGETGTGKTTIINTMVNYLLGVKFKDEKYYEITEEQEHKDQTKSQTSAITVYEVFDDENPISLTIIDTPGYAATEGFEKDGEIAEYLAKLFSSEFGIKFIDAVCFVMKASQNRLSGKEFYIFHSVLSLFGRDIENNIVCLLTHSDGGPPTNAINAINKAKIPCRRDEENQPVHFLFNNCQKEKRDKRYKRVFKSAWELGEESMDELLSLLEENNRKSVQMTLEVLKERKRLEACISNLNEQITEKELKMKELSEIQEVLKENREKIKNCENFQFTVNRVYKEKVSIENEWWWSSYATCCTVCEENCHNYCWWVSPNNLSMCSVMLNSYCTVCTGKCHYTKHVKENKKYVSKTKKVTLTFNDLEKEYERTGDKPLTRFDKDKYKKIKREHESNMKLYEEKTDIEEKNSRRLAEIEKEKSNLVNEAYSTIMNLSKIALKADSAFTLQYLDFLIPRLEEEGREEWMKNLEDLRKAADEDKNKGALHHLREFSGRKFYQFANYFSVKKE
ncbi:uncharacterized protein LOC127447719 [Myxocyprinus asiaticus]|uniref:uncharacterized protein LOC127447719 n=1 Tax=Myxocyprinus asiaticus TaxID=70543 RepID=UPI0022226467|nr:uncharacterized protein LOC127447719 [Myxocyprinus asiaticus]